MKFPASFIAEGLIEFVMNRRVFFWFAGDRGVKTKENINLF